MKSVVQCVAIAMLAFLHHACGSSDFISGTKTVESSSELDSTPDKPAKTALNLDWNWQCSDEVTHSLSSTTVARNGTVTLPDLS